MAETKAILPEGYKITELGPLPEDWEVMRLGEVVSFSRKPRGLRFDSYDKVPFIPMEYIPSRGSVACRYTFKSDASVASGVYCEPGDVLLAKITPSLENGKQGMVPQDLPEEFAVATTEVYPLKPDPSLLDKHLLFIYLLHPPVRRNLATKMEGSTGRQRLPKHVLSNLPLPLPPLPEQQAIAHVLRTIQEAKEATEKVIAATRELKKSLMRHLFTYGPVPVEEAESVPLKETEVGPVPEHWEVVKLGEVIAQTQYGLSQRGHVQGEYPILRMNNLYEGRVVFDSRQYVDLDEKTFAKYRLREGDLLFNRTNSHELVGKTALFDLPGNYVFASYLVRVITDSSKLLREYANYYLNAAPTQARLKFLASRGVSQSNISATKLKGFSIPLPPLPEQREIVRIFCAVDEKIAAEKNRKRTLETLFKTLLHHLMTGRLRVEVVNEAG